LSVISSSDFNRRSEALEAVSAVRIDHASIITVTANRFFNLVIKVGLLELMSITRPVGRIAIQNCQVKNTKLNLLFFLDPPILCA